MILRPQVIEGVGGPRGARTPDLLIANPTEGESPRASPGPSDSPDKDEPKGGTR
jgi:hypothetical protein